ncbi:MAG: site-specific DNA-methyltransferase, partial [Candidatus Cloacimonetes bacterium]|nr:site-specific DNA-methyltransferase [Candidatus Cloacimonadota bacterium]
EYFLDDHTDEFKKETYFHKGDIVLDPFCGSGTTLIQANELGMHAIGIDISAFNAQISNVKLGKYNLYDLKSEINKINNKLAEFVYDSNSVKFEQELLEELNKFNNKHFPTPGFRYKVGKKEINEWKFSKEKEKEFLEIFNKLVKKYKLEIHQNKYDSFLDKWYLKPVREEIDFVLNLVKKIETPNTKKVIEVILSRTIRSCRATTHSDLATLMKPISSTYYCHKHYKICKPLFSINGWWKRYSEDTIVRLAAFNRIRTETSQNCLTGDSRTIDIFEELEKENQEFAILTRKQKIKGIFSSPPYVGLIDYHEQHAYAYDLFKYERQDDLEIGPLCKGKGKEARESYIESISKVLINCKQYLADNYDVFLIANDKFNMYPNIAEKAGLKIVNKFKRPVLNRTEKDKAAYSEIIFHIKEK